MRSRAALVAVAGGAIALASSTSHAQVSADPGCWPFVVEIFGEGEHIGTGVAISTTDVLTVAQLVDQVAPGDLQVKVFDPSCQTPTTWTVSEVTVHPDYLHEIDIDTGEECYRNDVALIHLTEALPLGPSFAPAAISTVQGYVGQAVIVSANGDPGDCLEQACVQIPSPAEASALGYAACDPNTFSLFNADGTVNTCVGEQGSAVFIETEGCWKLAGIASWGVGGPTCGDEAGLIQNVESFYNDGWIAQNANGATGTECPTLGLCDLGDPCAPVDPPVDCTCINFEVLTTGVPTVDRQPISDEYASCGVSYEIVNKFTNQPFDPPKYPKIAEAGGDRTAFAGGCPESDFEDTVYDDHLAGIDLGIRFLTDDEATGLSGDLVISYDPPTRRTGGWVIDTDARPAGLTCCEQWTVTARRQDGSTIDQFIIDPPPANAYDPDGCDNANGPGDRMPQLWYFETTEDIYSVILEHTGAAGDVGVAFDHFCPYDIPFPCLEADTSEVLCQVDPVDGPTGDYTVDITITNHSGIPARYILLPDDVTEPDFIALPEDLPGDGGSITIPVTLTGATPLTDQCFTMVLADANVEDCCAGELVCVTVPECDCLQATNAQITCDPDTGVFTAYFDLLNLTGDDVEHVYVLPPLAPAPGSEVVIPDSYFDIPTLAPYQTATVGPITLENATPGTALDLRITMHVESFVECCSELITFALPPCMQTSTQPDPECEGDLDGDGEVGFSDLTALLGTWGPCAAPCPADLDGDGDVAFADLTALLGVWGPCS